MDTKEILSSTRFDSTLEEMSLNSEKHNFSKEQIC